MTPEQSLYVTVFLLASAVVAAALYAVTAIQRSKRDETGDDGAAGASETGTDVATGTDGLVGPPTMAGIRHAEFETDGETVTCEECGAENDPSYRYCRGCASELPGVWVGGQDVSDRGGRSVE